MKDMNKEVRKEEFRPTNLTNPTNPAAPGNPVIPNPANLNNPVSPAPHAAHVASHPVAKPPVPASERPFIATPAEELAYSGDIHLEILKIKRKLNQLPGCGDKI